MKKVTVEGKISDMPKIAEHDRIGDWLDELEDSNATVRLVIEKIEPRDGVMTEIE